MRDEFALRIIDLCQKKKYKQETIHLALNVFDTVLESGCLPKFSEDTMPLLLLTSVILAAKVEQPLTPSIKMTIKYLENNERLLVSKEQVMEWERLFLQIVDFDFSFLSPLTFLERFLRLVNIEADERVWKVSKKICLIARSQSKF